MPLDLTDDETAALARLLSETIDGTRYPLSPRILTLKAILAKIRPEPAQNPPAAAALRAAAERQLPETRLGVDADRATAWHLLALLDPTEDPGIR